MYLEVNRGHRLALVERLASPRMKRIRWRYSTRARIGWVVVAALLAITLSRAVASGLSARLIVNIGLLAAVAVVFAAVSRVMTDPERILAPELWESLEQLPSRDGKKRHADVVLRDGSVVRNVHFYEYRLISVGQRLPFRLPFKADQIASIRRRSP